MKPTIKVFSLSSDDEDGTNTSLFAFEEKAVDALLDKLEISTTVQTEFKEYTRDDLKRFYFFPDALPDSYEDFYELLNEIKDPADNYNIAEHLVQVEGPSIAFIAQIADMTQDGELLEDLDGVKYEFVLENDDAVSTLHALIQEARCAYCDRDNVPVEIEHIVPKGGRGRGTDRVSNLTLACQKCNQTKADQSVEAFLQADPARLERILSHRQIPLAAAATVNATRTKLLRELHKTHPPVEVSSGGKTKFNRTRLKIPKTHALDAACTGNTPALEGWEVGVLAIKAFGRGAYQRTNVNSSGAPTGFLTRKKKAFGFQTGDIVLATVPRGKRRGTHLGRVAVRARGSFKVQTKSATAMDISHRHCRILQRADGYTIARLLHVSFGCPKSKTLWPLASVATADPAFAFGSSKTKRLAKAKRKVERCIITVRIENYRYNR